MSFWQNVINTLATVGILAALALVGAVLLGIQERMERKERGGR